MIKATAEVLHSKTLAWLLDPEGSHGCGGALLEMMLNASRCDHTGNSGSQQCPKFMHVQAEWNRIDIVGLGYEPKVLLAIENKVNARQSAGQLSRYRKWLERYFPDHRRMMLFLTRYDEVPKDDGWVSLRYSQACEWVDRLLPKCVPAGRDVVAAYRDLLKDLSDARDTSFAASVQAAAMGHHSRRFEGDGFSLLESIKRGMSRDHPDWTIRGPVQQGTVSRPKPFLNFSPPRLRAILERSGLRVGQSTGNPSWEWITWAVQVERGILHLRLFVGPVVSGTQLRSLVIKRLSENFPEDLPEKIGERWVTLIEHRIGPVSAKWIESGVLERSFQERLAATAGLMDSIHGELEQILTQG